MKNNFTFLLIVLFVFLSIMACGYSNILDQPIKADSYEDFMGKIDMICIKTSKKTCGYMKEAVLLNLPQQNISDVHLAPIAQEEYKKVYQKLNGKTPRELIELYKTLLIKNLESSKLRNEKLRAELNRLHKEYERTKKYAQDIAVSDAYIEFTSSGVMALFFTVANNSEFSLKQFVAEAEFYSPSDFFLGRAKAFIYPLNPPLKPDAVISIKKHILSIPNNDLLLIRATKNLKIKVSIPSIETVRGDKFIISIPHSYNKMKELLLENENLYNQTVKKINSIEIE